MTNIPLSASTRTRRILAVGYGIASYVVFLVSFCYAIGFVGDIVVPRTVDHGIDGAPFGVALAINTVLLGLFAVQHSVMARPAFKRWWTRIIPPVIERSTYVLLASLVLLLMYWQWRTMPAVVWQVDQPAVRVLLWTLFAAGWAIVLAATFMINHFELFGLRQAFAVWRGSPNRETGFRANLLYRLVRHPLMLGFLVAFWATPDMTAGHLLFALGTTGYILIALQLEERDLLAALGEDYRVYRNSVPMLVPGLRPHRSSHITTGCPVRGPSG
ncbi:protein-S-isoprenylcysteine O-methyltransferase Ste14 [Mycolicibacterium sp. BK556]|uniref:methanethiol S-methyltransferase n=1 Tax=unclassified Mycolicibacterium TaxID=2636767 RepID=UPI00161CCFA6|nr:MULTISPECIES: methanethiol S-methyltransferase [unclassified Mycolicibacterium]MBB3603672.1 protein-S-isoprenylcysteine O-methyltransferase Ste14 [Mycolicibacterium sp. BK556]MBB3633867.1 protein-S-isoprenylcysteine O-methyltransferase Ste14 [Mycolicibacterium sp. BK607]MBB3751449.1 protein-S-isoprenylcysteine O-methyltransferase Ste14 [Mycolicibacterium sp. BK634]